MYYKNYIKYVKSFISNSSLANLIFYSPLFISFFNIISNFFEKVVLGGRSIFADFTVYRCGAITYINDINPYKPNALSECLNSYPNALDFFYPPFTLSVFSMFANLTQSWATLSWSLIIFPILFLYLILIKKMFYKDKNIVLFLLIYFFSFGGLNFTGLLTGNITIIFYSLLGVSLYYAITKKIILPVFVVLTVICLFKITYLIFLPLLFFIERKKFLNYSFTSLSVILIFYLYSYFKNPGIFIDFLNHLTYLRSSEFFNLYGGGFGLYSILKGLPELFVPGIFEENKIFFQFFWFLICGLFLLSMLIIFFKNNKLSKKQILSIGILIITICYPLMKDYEGFLLIPSIYYLLFNLNWKYIFRKASKIFKYMLIFSTFAVHDKYMLFLTASIILVSIFYLDYKKQKIMR